MRSQDDGDSRNRMDKANKKGLRKEKFTEPGRWQTGSRGQERGKRGWQPWHLPSWIWVVET